MFDANLKARIVEIAKETNLDPASLLAVVEVESGGKLFATVKKKLEPLIRFEGHYFHRLLPQRKRNQAIVKGLAHRRAGIIRNPRTQAGRWKLLKQAINIDREAALSSCSWGCGQVMGAHWRWLGYECVDALVREARSGGEGQVRLMMRYIEKAGLISPLQKRDWRDFARGYNGPAYARYGYHTKLERAHRRHAKSLDLPHGRSWMSDSQFLLRIGQRGEAVRYLQERLTRAGHTLAIDGDFGPATEHALRRFQADHDLVVDGIAGPRTFVMLETVMGV